MSVFAIFEKNFLAYFIFVKIFKIYRLIYFINHKFLVCWKSLFIYQQIFFNASDLNYLKKNMKIDILKKIVINESLDILY